MNWITTNIRFSEEDYMRLKIEAAQRRKSVAAIVREKVKSNEPKINKGNDVLKELDLFAKRNAKILKGINFTEALREMRYSQ